MGWIFVASAGDDVIDEGPPASGGPSPGSCRSTATFHIGDVVDQRVGILPSHRRHPARVLTARDGTCGYRRRGNASSRPRTRDAVGAILRTRVRQFKNIWTGVGPDLPQIDRDASVGLIDALAMTRDVAHQGRDMCVSGLEASNRAPCMTGCSRPVDSVACSVAMMTLASCSPNDGAMMSTCPQMRRRDALATTANTQKTSHIRSDWARFRDDDMNCHAFLLKTRVVFVIVSVAASRCIMRLADSLEARIIWAGRDSAGRRRTCSEYLRPIRRGMIDFLLLPGILG